MRSRKNDIERYLRGEMTSAEMHALEKEALHDRFLAEALEGIDHTGRESFLFDLQELNSSIHHRTRHKRGKIIKFSGWTVGIAATLLLVAVSSVFVFIRISEDQRKSLAMNDKAESAAEQKSQPVTPDDANSEKPGSDNNTINQPGEKDQDETVSEKSTASKPTAGASREEEKSETQDIAESQNQNPEGDPDSEPTVALSEEKKEDEKLRASGTSTGPVETTHVYGYVTSTENDKPVPGVNVIVKGSDLGTVTDSEGNFDLNVPTEKRVLEFSSIGLADVEKTAESKKKMNVEMSPDPDQMSEMAVTGDGIAKKGNETPPLKRDKEISFTKLAEPQGGRDAFKKYLEQKMQYPAQALQNKVEGKVTVQFTVNPNGNLEDFKVLKGIGSGCDEELLRLIKEGPAWNPSRKNDQPVQDKVKVSLKFARN